MHLVVTNKRDLTSDLVVLELQRRKLPYLRLNTEDFSRALIQWTPEAAVGWRVDLPDASFSTAEIRAAYFRRPDSIAVPNEVAHDSRLYCALEWHAALESLYWCLADRWLNAPDHIALAENKQRQLVAALRCGMKVPETLVTNNPDAAAAFCSAHEHIVGKPLRQALIPLDGGEGVVFTSRVRIHLTRETEAVKVAPMILQREIRKAYDIRVTVVGLDVFAAAIDSQAYAETQVDWRRSARTDLVHSVHQLPESLARQCIQLTQSLGLRFGAIDLVLDPMGDYWFLEINPNGQWGWIEGRTGHPIAASIVNELERIGAAIGHPV